MFVNLTQVQYGESKYGVVSTTAICQSVCDVFAVEQQSVGIVGVV